MIGCEEVLRALFALKIGKQSGLIAKATIHIRDIWLHSAFAMSNIRRNGEIDVGNKATAMTDTAPAPARKEPVQFSEEIISSIFSRIASGESMSKICQEPDQPSRNALFTWIARDPDVQRRYELALVMRTEVHAEQIIDIADDGENDTYVDEDGNKRIDHDAIARSKLRVDARKWHMSKMNPKRYGDKITQDVNVSGGGVTIYMPDNNRGGGDGSETT